MSDRAIQEAVQKLAGTHLKDQIHICDATVKSVDQMTRTCICTPIGGKAVTDIGNVRLMATVDDGVLLIPSVGSVVVVQWSTRTEPFIIQYGQIEKIITVAKTQIQFQDGEFGGLVIVPELITRLNNIEAAFNLLNTKVNSLVPTPVIPPLAETTVDEISNDFITHGGE